MSFFAGFLTGVAFVIISLLAGLVLNFLKKKKRKFRASLCVFLLLRSRGVSLFLDC